MKKSVKKGKTDSEQNFITVQEWKGKVGKCTLLKNQSTGEFFYRVVAANGRELSKLSETNKRKGQVLKAILSTKKILEYVK